MQRLADLRTTINTLDDARSVFDELARAEIALEKIDAAFEHRVAGLKREHQDRLAGTRKHHAELCEVLLSYLSAHPEQFKEPRKIKTEFGTFGLQAVNDLVITDQAALLECLMDRGYDDCMKVIRTPVKDPIKERIGAGETFPGCTLRTGDTAVYKVAKALLQAAREVPGD